MVTLTDTITELARRLQEDASLAYLRARIERELAAIEAILAHGVSLRKLALALSAAGVHQAGGQPLTYGNFRQLVARARHARDSTIEQPVAAATKPMATPPLPGAAVITTVVGAGSAQSEAPGAPDFSADPLGLRRRR
ncbi:hypothetical protein [Streptomyces rubiginosohelvolus]|uniref:hypothetical protein n=1 Tax=Streptomyces rubiginosohelvolus TaxID=67362 RepID=UPI0033F11C76